MLEMLKEMLIAEGLWKGDNMKLKVKLCYRNKKHTINNVGMVNYCKSEVFIYCHDGRVFRYLARLIDFIKIVGTENE